jgi:hypothetical protein
MWQELVFGPEAAGRERVGQERAPNVFGRCHQYHPLQPERAGSCHYQAVSEQHEGLFVGRTRS